MLTSYKRKPIFKDLLNLGKYFIDVAISPEMGFLRNQYLKIIMKYSIIHKGDIFIF